jgi:hypothetical protein
LSVGAGWLLPYLNPERPNTDLVASIQIPVRRSFVIEGEVIRSTGQRTISGYFDNRADRPYSPFSTVQTDHEALNVGVNVLVRKGTSRVTGFAGGGVGVHRSIDNTVFFTRCEPRVPGGCEGRPDTVNDWRRTTSGPSWQAIGGVDVAIAPRVAAFVAGRITPSLGAVGGVRVALRTRAAAAQQNQPPGPRVRVIGADRSRREGDLVSLGSSEVVILQDGRNVSIPLTGVRRVEKVTHRVRNGAIWGAIGGYVIGYVASCGGGDEEDCWPEIGAMVAGMGAAAGAATGAFENMANRERDVLYDARGSSASLNVAPILSPRRTGVALSVRW